MQPEERGDSSTEETSPGIVPSSSNKKRRRRNHEDNPNSIYHLPRIPRRDIRRQYAMMFANVYNSHDWKFMSNFVDTFFHQDNLSVLFKKYVDETRTNSIECQGRSTALGVWCDAVADTPDMIFSLDKTQIKVRSDGTAVVSSTFEVTGTTIEANRTTPKSAILEEIDQVLHPELYSQGTEKQLPPSPGRTSSCLDYSNDARSSVDCINDVSQHLQFTIEEESPPAKAFFSDFDQEFNAALDDLLNEDYLSYLNEEKGCVELQRWNSCSTPRGIEYFKCSGHFSLHLDAESKVNYVTYTIFDTQVRSE